MRKTGQVAREILQGRVARSQVASVNRNNGARHESPEDGGPQESAKHGDPTGSRRLIDFGFKDLLRPFLQGVDARQGRDLLPSILIGHGALVFMLIISQDGQFMSKIGSQRPQTIRYRCRTPSPQSFTHFITRVTIGR